MDIQRTLSAFGAQIRKLDTGLAELRGAYNAVRDTQRSRTSITAEIDAIPGRRLMYTLTGRIDFTLADNGRLGQPVSMLVSQDGPFIMTHYPMAGWLPSAPATATMFGLWRPVTPYPLPDQFGLGVIDGNSDIVSLSYQMNDSGSQRNLQNEAVPPVLSTPTNLVPLPVPTLFTPNSTIQFIPQYERILFNNGTVPPTQGTLVVGLPGYRIVNL